MKIPTTLLVALLFLFTITTGAYSVPDTFTVINQVDLQDKGIFISTENSGFLVSKDNGISWDALNSTLPEKTVYPFNHKEYRRITSFYIDPQNTKRIALSVSSAVYLSDNSGASWSTVPLGGAVKRTNYITSVALSSGNRDTVYIGTSFNGIYRSKNLGKSWEKLSFKNDPLYMGSYFYEEISSLAFNDEENILYIACALEGAVYQSKNGADPQRILLPDLQGEMISTVVYRTPFLVLYTERNRYVLEEASWRKEPLPVTVQTPIPDAASQLRLKKAADKKGIYINSFHASGDALQKLIRVIKANGYNSMVIDMKDDEGKVTYNTALKLPDEAGAVSVRFDLDELIETAHANGIYLIGRIVTFKDPVLFRYRNNAYAIWDSESNKPWGNLVERDGKQIQTEFWVDPFSGEVWDYNITIAEELQKRGIDEIQFDYIRFPSDGDLSRALFRYRRKGMSRIDALESFLRKVREKIRIPLSTDLYGFNSWYRMGNWIGQDIELFSRYVDVISPMFYPSHFPKSFKPDDDYLKWAYMIYRTGTARARRITGERVLIRPYVQAFLIGNELAMEKPEYTAYLKSELKGLEDSRSSGFTLWNNSNRYYMLE